MGWETRNGRKYYYRKVRMGGKVRSVYVGSDLAAAWYAESQLRGRQKRDVRGLSRWLVPQARPVLEQLDREVTLACEMIRRVTEVVLQEAGYHQHKGEWRRCLNHDSEDSRDDLDEDLDSSDSRDGHDEDLDEDRDSSDSRDGLDSLNSQGEPANHGNPGDSREDGAADVGAGVIYVVLYKAASPDTRREWEPVFRALLRDHPELWRDPSGQPHEAALEVLRAGQARVAARQLPHDSTLVLQMTNLQTELMYEAAKGLERLLIEQVLLAFLRYRLLQGYYGQARITIALANGTAEWEKRIVAAQRAYGQARRGLERVRGLAARRRRPLRI